MPQSRNGVHAPVGRDQTPGVVDASPDDASRKVNAVAETNRTATRERQERQQPQQEEERRGGTAVAETDGQVEPELPPEEEEGTSVKSLLSEALKKVTDEIEFCDEQIEKYESRKTELQEQLHGAMSELQSQFGTPTKKTQPKRRTQTRQTRRNDDDQPRNTGRNGTKSTRALITEYLEDVGEARTSEIRQFLEDSGKHTNPGVELSRMVKDKSIKNVDRGVYTLVRK